MNGFRQVVILFAISFLVGCRAHLNIGEESLSGKILVERALVRIDGFFVETAPSVREFECAMRGFSRSVSATTKIVNNFETKDGYKALVSPNFSEVSKSIHKLANDNGEVNLVPLDAEIRIESCTFIDPSGNVLAKRSWK